MFAYPKIQTLFKRGEKGRLLKELTRPEFGLEMPWLVTEKLDGMNLRVELDPRPPINDAFEVLTVSIAGRTDRADLSAPHISQAVAEVRAWFTDPTRARTFLERYPSGCCVFGELLGPKIQKNPLRLTEPKFVVFDVYDYARSRFVDFSTIVEGHRDGLYPDCVPFLRVTHEFTSVVNTVWAGFRSKYADYLYPAEGVVVRPTYELLLGDKARLAYKLKTKDYA